MFSIENVLNLGLGGGHVRCVNFITLCLPSDLCILPRVKYTSNKVSETGKPQKNNNRRKENGRESEKKENERTHKIQTHASRSATRKLFSMGTYLEPVALNDLLSDVLAPSKIKIIASENCRT